MASEFAIAASVPTVTLSGAGTVLLLASEQQTYGGIHLNGQSRP
jgi:hypothetical protein